MPHPPGSVVPARISPPAQSPSPGRWDQRCGSHQTWSSRAWGNSSTMSAGQERATLLATTPGQRKELQATARAQGLAEGPTLPWKGEEGRDHRPHLVELSPSMAESISSSQSSSKRPLGEAFLQLEPQLHHSRGPPGQRLGYGCWTCQ